MWKMTSAKGEITNSSLTACIEWQSDLQGAYASLTDLDCGLSVDLTDVDFDPEDGEYTEFLVQKKLDQAAEMFIAPRQSGDDWYAVDACGGAFWPDAEGQALLRVSKDPAALVVEMAADNRGGW